MEASSKLKLVAVFAVIGGPFLIYYGLQEKARLNKLERDGVTVDGFIEGGEWHKGTRSSSFKLDVSYTPQKGTPLRQTFQVTSDFFSAHANDTVVTDPAVMVRYVPSNIQDSAIVVGGSIDSAASFAMGLGAFIGGLLTLGVIRVRKC